MGIEKLIHVEFVSYFVLPLVRLSDKKNLTEMTL